MGSIKTYGVWTVVAGDVTTGKTTLLKRFSQNKFIENVPCYFDDVEVVEEYNNKFRKFHFAEIMGQNEESVQMQRARMGGQHVVLICFAVDNFNSFVSARDYWIPEARKYSEGTPIILVGTKIDQRNKQSENVSDNTTFVSRNDGEKLALKTNCVKYMETSALTGEGVKELFGKAWIVGSAHYDKIYNDCFCHIL